MLIQFEIKNFRSFNQSQKFMTLKGNFKRFEDHVYNHNDRIGILKVSGIYGANASGKTNLFKALNFVKLMVENDNYLSTLDARNLLFPFRMLNKQDNNESTFVVDFLFKSIIYNYELRVDKEEMRVTFEKLVKDENGKEKIIFKRTTNSNNEVNIFLPHKNNNKNEDESKFSNFLAKLLNPRSTLLSFFSTVNEDISNARKWFVEKVKFVFPIYESGDVAYSLSLKNEYLDLASRILKFSNLGIEKLRLDEIPLDIYLGEDNKSLKEQIKSFLNDKKYHSFKDSNGNSCTAIRMQDNSIVVLKIMTIHIDNVGSEVIFELDQESRGIIFLLNLLPAFILSYGEGVNYFIDEIGASLHPILLRELLTQYIENNIKDAKGQIIFNSHEEFVMDESIFRQDEIWLVEKEKNTNQSIIFPLSDFTNVRFDLNWKKNYLNGKFGGVPFDSQPNKLVFKK